MKLPLLKNHFSKCLLLAAVSLSVHSYTFAQQSTAPGIQKRLSDLFSSSKEEELLEPDLAFKLKVAASGPTTLVVDLIPANGYYLYRERIRFALKNARGVVIKSVKLPTGKVKNDPTFGKMETYEKPIQAEIALERAPNAKNVTLAASYQRCNEKSGVCYPPMDKEVSLTLP
jgi:thiol:disulfide interchange protein DsbD